MPALRLEEPVKIPWFLLAVAAAALVPLQAGLAATLRSGESVTVEENESIDDDLYVIGGQITVRGRVNGDLVVMGGDVKVTGPVSGSVAVMAGDTQVRGPVGGSVRAAGGNVAVMAPVGRDLLAAGGNVTTSETGPIGRDVLARTGNLKVSGPVGRDVDTAGGSALIEGAVARNVSAAVGNLRLTEAATVGGDLDWVGGVGQSLVGADRVKGAVRLVEAPPKKAESTGHVLWSRVRRLVGLLALGLVLALLFPRFFRQATGTVTQSVGRNVAAGLGSLLVVPLAAATLVAVGVLIGGWWLGGALAIAWLLALAAGYVVVSARLGAWALGRVGRPAVHPALAMALGVVALVAVGSVPVLGGLVAAGAAVWGLGALVRTLQSMRRPADEPTPTVG